MIFHQDLSEYSRHAEYAAITSQASKSVAKINEQLAKRAFEYLTG